MGLMIIIIVIIIVMTIYLTNKDAKKKDIKLLSHPTISSILLFIPLFICYYFIIAMISGLILNLFGEYLAYYGLVIGMALSPILSVITIIKINRKK